MNRVLLILLVVYRTKCASLNNTQETSHWLQNSDLKTSSDSDHAFRATRSRFVDPYQPAPLYPVNDGASDKWHERRYPSTAQGVQWWRGPNVCVGARDEKHVVAEGEDYLASEKKSECMDTGRRYLCDTRTLINGVKSFMYMSLRCCEGYQIQESGYCEPAYLQRMTTAVKNLFARDFYNFFKGNGILEMLRMKNVTLFVPTQQAFTRYVKQLQKSGKEDTRRRRSPKKDKKDSGKSDSNQPMDEENDSTSDEADEVEGRADEDSSGLKVVKNGKVEQDLMAHVGIGAVERPDFHSEMVLRTKGDGTIRLNVYLGSPVIMTANCVKFASPTDYVVTNGVMHQVEKVLEPVTDTLAQKVSAHPDLTTFTELLEKANMTWILENPEQHLTVLAPRDAAFEKMKSSKLKALKNGAACLHDTIKQHIVVTTICSTGVYDRLAEPTLSGTDLLIERNDAKFYAGKNRAQFVEKDLVATNGVLHVVDDIIETPLMRKTTDVLSDMEATTFLELLGQSGLTSELNMMTNITVFAPSDEAIRLMGKDELDKLKDDQSSLKDWLLNHVTEPTLKVCEMNYPTVLTSKADKPVRINFYVPSMMQGAIGHPVATAQCAPIQRAVATSCGGYVYVLDSTINTPKSHVVNIIKKNDDLSTFYKILEFSRIHYDFKGDGPWTIMAPTNAAFAKKKPEELKKYQSDRDLARSLVMRHVIREELCCAFVPKNTVFEGQPPMVMAKRMLDRYQMYFYKDDIGRVFAEQASVTGCDVTATNGLVHIVDMVLM